MLFKEITNKDFIGFNNKINNTSIYQTPEYGFIMNNEGYDSVLLGMYDKDTMVAASLLLIRKENGFKYAYAPKGFLLDYENEMVLFTFTNYIKKYLGKKGIIGVKINPLIIKNIVRNNNIIENPKYNTIYNNLIEYSYYHLGYNNFFESLKPRFEAVIDLTNPIDTLFNKIKKEYRTKIRSCYSNGVRVYKGNIETLDYIKNFTEKKSEYDFDYYKNWFKYFSTNNMIDIYYTKLDTNEYLKNTQKKLNYYEKKSEHYNEIILKKSQENPYNIINKKINVDKYYNQYQNDIINATKLLREYPDGIITSAILVVKNKKEATILIDSYDKKYKKLNSKHLLIWQLIQIYKNEGYTKFNLGGMSNITINNKYNGLNEFKIGFGADIYEYAGDFELITNKRNYELYRNFVPLKKLIKK